MAEIPSARKQEVCVAEGGGKALALERPAQTGCLVASDLDRHRDRQSADPPKSPHPHDIFFKKTIGLEKYAIKLIPRNMAPELAERIDWGSLRREPGSYIDERYRKHSTDALFSVSLKDRQGMQIAMLLEHKSYPDPHIHKQLLRYQAKIYEAQKIWKPLLLQVYYHGQSRWNQPLSFFDKIFERIDPKSRGEEILYSKVLNFEYELFDLSREDLGLMQLSLDLQAILYALRNIWRLHEEKHIRILVEEHLNPLRAVDRDLWKKIVDYWLHAVNIEPVSLKDYFPEESREDIMSTASQLKEIGRAEGMKKGIEKGRVEGMEKGIERGIEKGIAKGIEKGRAEGIEKGIEKIARRMLREGLEHDQVCRYTGLSLKELLRLAKER